MDTREINKLTDLADKILENIDPEGLYRQKELLDILGISYSTYKKYFLTEDSEKEIIDYKRQKFIKGYMLRLAIIDLNLEASRFELNQLIQKLNDTVPDKLKNKVDIVERDETNPWLIKRKIEYQNCEMNPRKERYS